MSSGPLFDTTGGPRPPPRPDVTWAAPSRRLRLVAAALAIVFASITFAVVVRVWRHGAPPAAPRGPVEVKLIAPVPAPR